MLTENQLFANRYRLVKRLGQGAFSEVWKAEDIKVGNLIVALKVYAPDKGLDEDGAKVFGDEFAIVFNIHHQNLLTPSTFDEENGSPYLVLPFCERGSSLSLVGKMDEHQSAQFLRDVSSALAYLHESEIVHQDIKPDNVLMDAKGNFLVTDFGISTRIRSTLRRSVGDKKSAGTMAYMGPERFGRNPKPIKASDVWSLGATVYELMSGDVPFGDMGGGMQTAGAIVPELEGNYSAPLKQLVEQCLAKETWDRPTAAQIRDICDGYLRTGTWNLSSLGKGGSQEPEKPKEPAGRPTERKVRHEFPDDSVKLAKEEPSKIKSDLPWIIVGIAIVVIFATVLGKTFGKSKKHNVEIETEKIEDVVEEPAARIPDPETKSLAQTYTVNGVSFVMKYVEGGTFQMGATSEQSGDAGGDEYPEHSVTLSDFCLGETEVTQALWKAVMGSNPSYHKGNNRPVETVSWNDCQEFIRKLNQLTGKNFRLPTEAEWEYAARGGNKSCGYKYSGSNTIDDVAWYSTNTNYEGTNPVKTKSPNELGLYDMSGNVLEWCQDKYGSNYYRDSPSVNPTGRESNKTPVLRGGDYSGSDRDCRVSRRKYWNPDDGYFGTGFRLALVP